MIWQIIAIIFSIMILLIILIEIIKIKKNNNTVENYTSIGKNMDLEKMTIMSSENRTVVLYDDKLILEADPGVSIIVINDKNNITVTNYNTICCNNDAVQEIARFVNYVDKINLTDTIIIVTKGNAFNFYNINNPVSQTFIKKLREIGSTVGTIVNNMNYILITNKIKNIHYEATGIYEPVFYPKINVKNKECKKDPRNIMFPSSYLFYKEKSYDRDSINRCAAESRKMAYDKFAIIDDKCLPLSDSDYVNKIMYSGSSTDCNEYSGFNGSMAVYTTDTDNSNNIKIFSEYDFTGYSTTLSEGYHNAKMGYFGSDQIIKNIKSISVPDKYIVIIVTKEKKLFLSGPTKVNIDTQYPINTIIVQKKRDNHVMACTKNNSMCMTFGPGNHIIDLNLKFTDIHFGTDANEIYLYGDVSKTDLIEHIVKKTNNVSVPVKYSRIVRAVTVK